MPNIENLAPKPFIKTHEPSLLSVRRQDILYREDLTTGFVFVVVGITTSLAVAGTIYVVEREVATEVKVTNDPDPITKFQQRQAKTEQLNNHGALTGFYEESLKGTIETKTAEFKQLLQANIAYVEKKSKDLIANLIEKVLPIEATPQNFDCEKDADYRVLLRDDLPQSYADNEEYQTKITTDN
ncbi:13178_t:CDS:2 [Entrophospora sp. SA101]|nr:3926_t:CDS:2 [Entrophospora sp. SA101]CAJ0761269.1 13178_t:CDS:2 [Entrophospora sp. SA101]CAJ0830136.1 79_t:CDS:2 [Entrophospora sp. SA101]CAJ0856030.1 17308_t:CDS:2 [Entrophospora sp. SA101]